MPRKPQKRGTPPQELWSAISQGDLGLKAGYWTGDEADPVSFRPILGWITCVTTKANTFHPVVLSDNMWPRLAHCIEPYCGVFPKEMSPDEAKAKVHELRDAFAGELHTDDREGLPH